MHTQLQEKIWPLLHKHRGFLPSWFRYERHDLDLIVTLLTQKLEDSKHSALLNAPNIGSCHLTVALSCIHAFRNCKAGATQEQEFLEQFHNVRTTV